MHGKPRQLCEDAAVPNPISFGVRPRTESQTYARLLDLLRTHPVASERMGFLTEEKLAEEAARYGKAGARPQVIWPNGVLASAAVGLGVELTYDGNQGTLSRSPMLRNSERRARLASRTVSKARQVWLALSMNLQNYRTGRAPSAFLTR
jgi:hypothetical protein